MGASKSRTTSRSTTPRRDRLRVRLLEAMAEQTDDWLLADVTRVDVLGGYEEALALVARPRAEECATG